MKVPTEFEGVFRDIELTEREIGFLVWVAGWDSYTIENLKSVVQKVQATRVIGNTLQPSNESLTQADLDSMDYDKVWIDYGDDGEWALVVNGRIYCLAVLEGAGFEDILREELGGETLDRPSGDYTVYRRPTEVSP